MENCLPPMASSSPPPETPAPSSPPPPPPPPSPPPEPTIDTLPDFESNGETLIPITPDLDPSDEDEVVVVLDASSDDISSKKRKSLSSLSSPSAKEEEEHQPPPPPHSKKPKKKKNNNVWTKPTSRKTKKKPKHHPNHNPNGHHNSGNHHPNHHHHNPNPTHHQQQQQHHHHHHHSHHPNLPPQNHHDPTPSSAAKHETVLITPVPRFPDRSDDSPEALICLSRGYKAEKVEVSDDRLSAGSTKGYRMVRATRGVVDGAWYFEIRVVRLGDTGHTRLGWTTEKGDLQAPVGYDANSYGYRDIDGSKIHRALREKYGVEGYCEGDVVGFYINLPDGQSFAPKPPHLVWYKGQRYTYPADGKDDHPKVVPGSEISFFKNGVCQGVAYTDLFGGRYYPAASMYTLPNQPNCEVRFNFGPNFDCFPQDFGTRPIPRPMSEVPYHGHDSRVESAAVNGQQEQPSATADCQLETATSPTNDLAAEVTAVANNPPAGESAVANNPPVGESAVANNPPVGETIATCSEQGEEVIAAAAYCPLEEMAADENGSTTDATFVSNDPPEQTTAIEDGLTEVMDVAANASPE